MKAPRRPLPTPLILLLIGMVIAWLPSLNAPFTYDDKVEVVGNRTIRMLDEWQAVATYNFSRPLLILSYAINWQLSGLNPLGYHLISLAIHLINALLVVNLLKRWFSPERALLAGALWAAHPMVTESVTYITGRSDALCATFMLLAMIAHTRNLRGEGSAIPVYAASAAALLTKEVAITLPLILIAMEAFLAPPARAPLPARRPPLQWKRYLPFFMIGGLAVLVRLGVYGWPRAEVERGVVVQLVSQAEVWVKYLRLWLLPYGQSILHDHPARISVTSALSVVAWVAAGAWALRRGGATAFAFCLWSLALLPSSLISLKETMSEHRSYLAGLGVALVVSSLGSRLAPLVPVLLLATFARNFTWRSEVALWGQAAERNPTSVDAWYGYADALRLAQRWAEAEAGFRKVTELDPKHEDGRINLGITLAQQGKLDEASSWWRKVLKDNPKACPAHNNLAALSARDGQVTAAIQGYLSTLRWCPDDPLAHLNLGDLYKTSGDTTKASWHYRRYLELLPDGPRSDLARAYLARMGG